MKKLLTISTIIALCLAFGGLGIAQANTLYFVDPPPYIQEYQTSASGAPTAVSPTTIVDKLDDAAHPYQTYGAKLVYNSSSDEKLYIYTTLGTVGSVGSSFTEPIGGKTVVPADLFLTNNVTGTQYAVRLQATGLRKRISRHTQYQFPHGNDQLCRRFSHWRQLWPEFH